MWFFGQKSSLMPLKVDYAGTFMGNDFSPYQCAGCLRGISPEDMVYKLKMDIVYHVACHKCFQCGKQLAPGEQILVDEPTRRVSCVNHSSSNNQQPNSFFDQVLLQMNNNNNNCPFSTLNPHFQGSPQTPNFGNEKSTLPLQPFQTNSNRCHVGQAEVDQQQQLFSSANWLAAAMAASTSSFQMPKGTFEMPQAMEMMPLGQMTHGPFGMALPSTSSTPPPTTPLQFDCSLNTVASSPLSSADCFSFRNQQLLQASASNSQFGSFPNMDVNKMDCSNLMIASNVGGEIDSSKGSNLAALLNDDGNDARDEEKDCSHLHVSTQSFLSAAFAASSSTIKTIKTGANASTSSTPHQQNCSTSGLLLPTLNGNGGNVMKKSAADTLKSLLMSSSEVESPPEQVRSSGNEIENINGMESVMKGEKNRENSASTSSSSQGVSQQYPYEMYAFGEMYTMDADSKYGRRRGPRTTIKQEQLDILNQIFAATPKPSKHARAKLALDTGLSMRVIQVWFQNRRSKERRLKHLCNFLRHYEQNGNNIVSQQQQISQQNVEFSNSQCAMTFNANQQLSDHPTTIPSFDEQHNTPASRADTPSISSTSPTTFSPIQEVQMENPQKSLQ